MKRTCLLLISTCALQSAAEAQATKPQPLKSMPGILAPLSLTEPQKAGLPDNTPPASKPKGSNASELPLVDLHSPPITSSIPTGTTITCRVPVQNIGPLTLRDNVALIDNKTLEVRNRAISSNTAPPSLNGIVLKHDAPNSASNGEREMTGLVFFTGGEAYLELGNRTGEDMIFRNEGSISGDIIGYDDCGLMMRTRDGHQLTVPFPHINYVRSPRAYLFTLTGKPAMVNGAYRTLIDGITFRPTFTEDTTESTPTSVVPGHHRPGYYSELEEIDQPQGFVVTTPQSRYQPALGNQPVFNQLPPGLAPLYNRVKAPFEP